MFIINPNLLLIFFKCYLLSSRLYQAAKLFMFCPSSGLYSCPLAMTDGAAKTVEVWKLSLFFAEKKPVHQLQWVSTAFLWDNFLVIMLHLLYPR